ncbi:amphiphysin isoform X1 [Calliphora vicina]|uniref:amphiphysin isoform X1 n=1 Tax=Calliphora vicina TaxID=7373 RepID=UPI00325AD44B
MAENKGIMLAKSVQKHAGRAKEKILQNLGKVDRTADEIFDDHLNNFNRQQLNANRLQKEFNNYIRCIRAAQTASKSLMDAIAEIYEPQWSGYDALQAQAQSSESLWQDFAHKLADQVLIPLNTYTGQFPEMKKKVEKRNRKLIDYDGQRHSFQSLQANANKRKDDVKLTKGREQLEEARRTYELLNTELHDELPALYESRILFLVTNLQTLFATEQVFHNETAKIYSELEAIVDKLATESQRGSNTLRKATVNAIKSASPVQSPVKQMNNANITNSNNQYQNTNGSANPPSPSSSSTQESRLDNVSPTPESSAGLLRGGGASVSGMSKMETSSTTSGNLANDATSMESTTNTTITTTTAVATKETDKEMEMDHETAQLNSPNANTLSAATTTTITSVVEETSNKNSPAATLEKITSEETSTTTTMSSATKEDVDMNNALATEAAAATKVTTTEVTEVKKTNEQMNGNDTANGNANTVIEAKTTTTTTTTSTTTSNGNNATTTIASATTTKTAEDEEQSNKTKLDATTTDLPPGVLYRVKATYGYVKEDVDELSFEVGDIIRVIEYDDPEDQEEGWLMGEKEGSTEKGLFPANFTRPI